MPSRIEKIIDKIKVLLSNCERIRVLLMGNYFSITDNSCNNGDRSGGIAADYL